MSTKAPLLILQVKKPRLQLRPKLTLQESGRAGKCMFILPSHPAILNIMSVRMYPYVPQKY